ncbi:MAG: TetR/AcrR family transcriptional regulator [Pseudorhizobium sp.]
MVDDAVNPAEGGENLTDTVTRGRGRPKLLTDDVQAARIAEVTRRLFLAQGYGGTTMTDVAAACRISKRTLYQHFPGKTELLEAVITLHRTSMLALPGDYDEMPLTTALEKIFVVDIDEEGDAERAAFLRLIIVEAAQYPEIGELMGRLGADTARAMLAAWLQRQKSRGRLDVDDVGAGAQMLMDMVFGAVVTKKGHGPEWPGLEDRKAYLRRCIRIFVHGVATGPTPQSGSGPQHEAGRWSDPHLAVAELVAVVEIAGADL